jgi:hypothetical protein
MSLGSTKQDAGWQNTEYRRKRGVARRNRDKKPNRRAQVKRGEHEGARQAFLRPPRETRLEMEPPKKQPSPLLMARLASARFPLGGPSLHRMQHNLGQPCLVGRRDERVVRC